MATTRKDVELRINANDLSQKSLQQLLDTFDKLRAAQDAFAKSGDGTQRSVRELKQDLTDLQAVATELKSRAALVDQFLAIEKRATEAANRVDQAKAALQRFNAAQTAGAELTKKEQAELTKLSREVAKAEKSFTTSTAKLNEFRVALSEIGAGDTSATREALLRFSADLGAALGVAEQSIRRYDETLRASAAKEKAASEAREKAAVATRELKAAQDALANSVAFNAQGREALKAASNIDALSRDYDKLAASGRKAGDGIRAVLDPSRQAVSTLDGLEAEVKRLNGQLDAVQLGPQLGEQLKSIRTQYNAFAADAGRAAASLVDDIGSYRKVEESLAALRARIEGAQQSVREFAGQMAVASEPSEKLSQDLAASQARLKGFVGEFERESQALANLRVRLREAGVDVNALADAEARLAGVASGVVGAQQKIEAVAQNVTKLAQSTTDLKAAEEALKSGVAFNQLGRDALKAAENVAALSRDYDALVVSSRKAGDAIRGIIDPSRQALTTIEGLDEQTRKLNDQLQAAQSSAKLREQVRQLRTEYAGLANDAGKAAASLVDDIGAYRQAEQALGTLRSQVEAAQQKVRSFAGQMAVAASPSETLAKSLATAKTQLNTLSGEFERQATALARMGGALRDAGIDTNRLADAEARLDQVARRVLAVMEALGVAAARVGDGAAQGSKGLGDFDDKGRKALSIAQRLRGELLSLASAYLGFFAAINVAKGAVDAAVSREGIMRRLELTEGSVDAAKKKFEELGVVADKLGVNFEQSAKGFSDIAIGAKEAGFTSAELDSFFLDLATTTRGLSLDTEKTGRVFTAVTQIFNKAKVQSEELVQQLGEHLPAVVKRAANVLQMDAKELQKALEAGTLGPRALAVIFSEYAKHIRELSKQDDSAVESLGKFENAMYRLKLAIGDNKFLKEFTDLLNDITARFKAGEFDETIKKVGQMFALAAAGAKFLVDNLDATVFAFEALIALNVGKLVLGIAASLKTMGVGAWLAADGVAGLRVALTLLSRHPIVALVIAIVTVLATLAATTDRGRAAARALWQAIVELNGAFEKLVRWDFEGLVDGAKGAMDRVAAAFRGTKARIAEEMAKGDKADIDMLAAKIIQEQLAKRGIKADIVDNRPKKGTAAAASAADDDPQVQLEKRRKFEAELTANTVANMDKHLAEVRKAAARETAKSLHNIEAEVKADYMEQYTEIENFRKDGVKRQSKTMEVAAANMKSKLDEQVAIIVAAKKKQQAELEGKKFAKGDVNEALEAERQKAEITKEGIRLEQSELEISYKEGLVSLRDYYAKRLDETNRGLDAEIEAARNQIDILETTRGTDPNAGKKITKLQGEIARKQIEKAIAEHNFRLETELGEKALRRQVGAIQQELDELTGDDRQAGLRAVQNYYIDQLEQINRLNVADKERAKNLLDQVVALKAQLVDIQSMAKQAEHLANMRGAAIDASVATGDLSHIQELNARSEANKARLADLEEEAQRYREIGLEGSDAYKSIQERIVRLRGDTDLLANEVTATFKSAATSLVETLIRTKSPQQAIKAFGKSLGAALSKALVDEAATSIVKLFKDSGVFDLVKSLFKSFAGFFGGGTTAGTGHTGAVIGYGGVPRRVSPLAFLQAPRYHSGGLPGLRRDEVAFIGLKGEEVLSRNDPRNVKNGGKNASGPNGGVPQLVVPEHLMRVTMQEALERMLATAYSKM